MKNDNASVFVQSRTVPIATLARNPRNPRVHSKKQIRKIASSIRKFGFLNPIIVDENNTVLAGHGRLEAAQIGGLTHVPVVCFGHLTPLQKRAYLIADNKIAEEAGWNRELLAIELSELTDLLPVEGLDVSVTGFATPEVDLLLADMGNASAAEESMLVPLPKRPVTQEGDLWQLGRHRLLCGDAQKTASFNRLLEGTLANAVFCDPPYNVRVSSIGGRGRIQHQEFAFASGEMSSDQFRKFLTRTLGNGIRVSKPGAVHFVCMDWRHVEDLIAVGRKIFGAMLNLAVWNKSNAGQGSFYRSQHELVGIFRVGENPHKNNIELGSFGRNRSNVWSYPGVNTFGRHRLAALAMHPTVKPTAMVADALLDCTARGDAVLDQFAGSGTIFLAAEKVGRVGYGIELDPRYVDVAIRRWQSMTKLEAILEGDGRTFEEIEEARSKASVETSTPSQERVNSHG
ncbi:MAG: DNA modification methylase [Afipia sp.]|nr:MAG: DNA modification methylase [Afipia sp.]